MNKNVAIVIVAVLLLGMGLITYNEYINPGILPFSSASANTPANIMKKTAASPSVVNVVSTGAVSIPPPQANNINSEVRDVAVPPKDMPQEIPKEIPQVAPEEIQEKEPAVVVPEKAEIIEFHESTAAIVSEKVEIAEPIEIPKAVEPPKVMDASKEVEVIKKSEASQDPEVPTIKESPVVSAIPTSLENPPLATPYEEKATLDKKGENKPSVNSTQNKKKIIKKMSVLKIGDGITIRLDSNEKPKYRYEMLSSPDRLVVYLAGTWKLRASGVPQNTLVSNVRVGQHPNSTHIVVDLHKVPRSVRFLKYGTTGLDVRIR